MKRLIFALAVLATPALAQAPNDAEIIAAKKICDQPGLEVTGALAAKRKAAGLSNWRTGYENCEAVMQAYSKSKPAIDAKIAADAAVAEKAAIDALAARIK